MIWELSDDTADAELLGIASKSLHDPLEENVFKQRSLAPRVDSSFHDRE